MTISGWVGGIVVACRENERGRGRSARQRNQQRVADRRRRERLKSRRFLGEHLEARQLLAAEIIDNGGITNGQHGTDVVDERFSTLGSWAPVDVGHDDDSLVSSAGDISASGKKR